MSEAITVEMMIGHVIQIAKDVCVQESIEYDEFMAALAKTLYEGDY